MAGSAAHAADFDLPGLDADSAGFAAVLSKPLPTGGTANSRSQAEARAAAAAGRNDWTTAATALESRLGQSEAGTELIPTRSPAAAWHCG